MELNELTHRNDFGKLCESKGFKVGAEIGVAYGENAEKILEGFSGKLFLIDPWIKQTKEVWPDNHVIGHPDGCRIYCEGKLSRFKDRIEYIRKMSDAAVGDIADDSLDFVYLDGNHSRPQIDRDLENWWGKVKKGGIFGGHDYYTSRTNEVWSEVEDAVNDFIARHGLTIHNTKACSSWWIQK